jgi:ABC-type nitrate/sulfonate/bicarbonate transport system permease component
MAYVAIRPENPNFRDSPYVKHDHDRPEDAETAADRQSRQADRATSRRRHRGTPGVAPLLSDRPRALRRRELWGTAVYWNAVATTMTSWGLGLLVSVIVGVPLGLIIGSNAKIEVSVRLIVDFLRTIPSIAFLPLALLMFGVDLRTPVILIFLAAVWPLLIQSTYAASQIDPVLKQVRRSFHLSWWQYIRFQFAPSALPFITTGLRIAATICLLTAIAVELLSGAPGVGSQLQGALIVSQSATLYAYVLTAGVLGILINVLLVWLQRVLIWWHPSVRGDAR